MTPSPNDKLAVLIDAENAQATIIHELLAEVSRYGTASVKRAYGDWTTTNLKGWKEVLHKMAIQPIQQFSYTSRLLRTINCSTACAWLAPTSSNAASKPATSAGPV